jgi:peptide chain release factor 1
MTDHRINLTIYKLDSIIGGKLEEVIYPLITHDQAEKLKAIQ